MFHALDVGQQLVSSCTDRTAIHGSRDRAGTSGPAVGIRDTDIAVAW